LSRKKPEEKRRGKEKKEEKKRNGPRPHTAMAYIFLVLNEPQTEEEGGKKERKGRKGKGKKKGPGSISKAASEPVLAQFRAKDREQGERKEKEEAQPRGVSLRANREKSRRKRKGKGKKKENTPPAFHVFIVCPFKGDAPRGGKKKKKKKKKKKGKRGERGRARCRSAPCSSMMRGLAGEKRGKRKKGEGKVIPHTEFCSEAVARLGKPNQPGKERVERKNSRVEKELRINRKKKKREQLSSSPKLAITA